MLRVSPQGAWYWFGFLPVQLWRVGRTGDFDARAPSDYRTVIAGHQHRGHTQARGVVERHGGALRASGAHDILVACIDVLERAIERVRPAAV